MFIVEGNTGTGKTTMLEAIQKYMPYVSVQFESVHNWQNKKDGPSILEKFYTDTPRWAYTMEITSLTTRIPEHFALQQKKDAVHFLERSVYSGFHCFAHNDFNSKFLTSVEWEVFKQWFDFAIRKCNAPQGFIYLQADPKISYERVRERNRAEELTLPLKYVHQIHERHEDFLIHKRDVHPSIKDTPVLVLNCDVDFTKDHKLLQSHLRQIELFISNIRNDITPQYKYDAYQL